MGFYGNITNTARTQFQFDKVYPNRYEMEQKTKVDGIYAGRYVLIEYDSDTHLDHMTRVWISGNKFYTQPDKFDNSTLLKEGNVVLNEIVYTAIASPDRVDPRDYRDCIFYKCVGFSNDASKSARFEEIVNGGSDPNTPAYTVNYNMDIGVFGAGRGYDSTVWQKTYTAEAGEKYVMIAELNTVVPTFAVTPDAPTMNPVVPHFDQQSTDVYYKLHWQAPWGFRVKETTADKSDEFTTHTTTTYNPSTGKNTVVTEEDIIAAIYFNEAAFDAQVDATRTSEADINKHAANGLINEIKVEPTGKSGNKYNDHDGAFTQSEQVDIQEMTINLPAIGNMMSDAWDIIHGPLRNDDMRQVDESGKRVDSLQGRLNSIAAIDTNQIPIKRIDNGKLVGTKINGDVRNTSTDNYNAELSSSYEGDDAWIETKVDADNTPNAIAIHHTFHETPSSTSSINKNSNFINKSSDYKEGEMLSENLTAHQDQLRLYVPYVDKAGHVVGQNIETVTLPYSYREFITDSVSNVDSEDLYTEITSDADGAHVSEVNAAEGYSTADQTQDIMHINPYNKWIQVDIQDDNIRFAHEIHAIPETVNGPTNLNSEDGATNENNINIPDWSYDKAGHIIEKHDHYYTLPYGFKTIKTNGRSTEVSENATDTPTKTDVVAENTQDALTINSGNKWVRIDTDAANDTITIRHDVHNTSSTNNTTDWTKTEANTTIPTITYAYDEAGHYVSHHTENYKLPFGYGKIVGDNNTSTAATATYDELTFASDEWLTATVAKDKVTYSHDYPKKVDDTTSDFDVNGNGDTIVLETLERDDKGHVIKVNQNTVTLPYGYKTFTGDSGTSSADNTQDTMSVTGDNQWIQTAVTNDSIAFAHIGPVTGTAVEVEAKTPAFGATFTIDDHYFDDKGHKFTSKSHTVKIPQPSLTNGTGNVVTGLSLTPSSGAFVETKADLGAIKLGSYEVGDSAADLSADITLQQALSRLQNKIANEVTARQNAIAALDVTDTAVEGQYVASVSEQDGKIIVNRKNLPTYSMLNGTEAGTVIFNGAAIKVGGFAELAELVTQLSAEVSTLRSEVNRLNDIVAQVHPEFVTSNPEDDEVENI